MFPRAARSFHSGLNRTSKFLQPNNITTRLFSSAALQSSLESGLNDDQLAFQELAVGFMEEKMKPFAKEWDAAHHCSYEVIKEAADLGFGGLYCSEEFGGTGLSRHDSSLIFEALSQGCVPTTAILTIHNMSAWMLDAYGSNELKNEFLSDLIQCNLLGSYCLTEPHSGSDAAALTTSCVPDGDDLVINGSKMFISGGGQNDLYFVMTRTGICLCLFDFCFCLLLIFSSFAQG